MLIRRAVAGASVLLALGVAATAAASTDVAVTDLKPVGVEDSLARALTVVLTAEIQKRGYGSVISTTDIDALIGMEKTKDLVGCDDVSCYGEIVGALDVARVVAGSLSRAGDTLVLELRLLDTRALKVENRVYQNVRRPDEAVILMPMMVDDLFATPVATKPAGRKDEGPVRVAVTDADPFGPDPGRQKRIVAHVTKKSWTRDQVQALVTLWRNRWISDAEYNAVRAIILADMSDPSRGRAPVVTTAGPRVDSSLADVLSTAVVPAKRVDAILASLAGRTLKDQALRLGELRRSRSISDDEYLAVRQSLLFRGEGPAPTP